MTTQAHVEAETVLRLAASQAKVCAGRHHRDSAWQRCAEPGAGAARVYSGTLLLHWHREQAGAQRPDRMRHHRPADGGHVLLRKPGLVHAVYCACQVHV